MYQLSDSSDPYQIATIEALRERMGVPSPIVHTKVWSGLEGPARNYIESSPFLLLATADTAGNIDVSPKGDGPGFVAVEDDSTLLIPDRRGNKLLFGLQNILENPHVGVIFLKPGTEETLRVNGRAELTADPAVLDRLTERGQPALIAIRIHIDECFFHCAKAFKRARLWEPESWTESMPVSWGKLMAAKLGGGEELVRQIDAAIEADATNL